MINLTLVNFFTILSIFGYSAIYKKILFKDKNIKINNLDFLYGLLILYLISLILHYFIPLKSAVNYVLISGLIIFFIEYSKKNIRISIVKYLILTFILSVFAFYTSDNVDGPMYHLQIINWLQNYKLTFGLANLENRFGVNYPWHSIIAIASFEFNSFSNKLYIISILLIFIFYEIIDNKFNKYNLFLILSISYLFFFSLIHPFNFGTILNHYGNVGKDIFNMLIFFIVVYLFLIISNLKEKDHNDVIQFLHLFYLTALLLLLQSQQYFFLIILILFTLSKFNNYPKFGIHFFILSIVLILWIFKNFIISGCILFPHKVTCFDVSWALDKDLVQYLMEEVKRHNRSLPTKSLINNHEATLHSLKWVVPWFKEYYLTTALHQINTLIYLIFVIVLIAINAFKIKFKLRNRLLIFTLLLINLTCFYIPELRYAWGPHISIAAILIFELINITQLNKINKFKLLNLLPIFLLVLFIYFKIFNKFKTKDLLSVPIRQYDFSKKKLVGTFDGYKVYFNHWKCGDMKEICINIPRSDFKFIEYQGFLFISRNNIK